MYSLKSVPSFELSTVIFFGVDVSTEERRGDQMDYRAAKRSCNINRRRATHLPRSIDY